MSTSDPQFDERLDVTTSRRLARLGTMPVETSRLRAALDREIGAAGPRGHGLYGVLHSMRAVAASVAALLLVGAVVLYMTAAPATASAAEMVKLHRDLVEGRTPVMQVDSIEAANRHLASESTEAPELPGVPPTEHEMACCMKSVDNKRVACLLLKGQTAPVTMMVAKASDMKSPTGQSTIVKNAVTYHTHASGDLNMVSCVRDGRYVCLIGSLPVDALVDLAAGLRF